MSDVFSKSKRSQVMSSIRSSGNRETELALIRLFRSHRITGWRRRQPLFGKPDFVFRKLRVALFVDGCFWHSCPLHATKPKTNAAFWRRKLAANSARDRLVNRSLRARGWRILRVWEHELAPKKSGRCARRVIRALTG
ncbi:very short patch repair endonuclease [Candidatus Sumerlaeota bacterium]|nr:very short patch repair endonuclease [Candidatus Sumerlaeota bacterium]